MSVSTATGHEARASRSTPPPYARLLSLVKHAGFDLRVVSGLSDEIGKVLEEAKKWQNMLRRGKVA